MSSQSSVPDHGIFLLLFGIVDLSLALLLFALNVSFIRSLLQHRQLLRRNIVVISISLAITISFALYPIFAGSACMVRVHGYFHNQDAMAISLEHSIMIPAAPLYWIVQSLIILLFVIRMDMIFGSTQWALSRKWRQSLLVSSTLLIVLSTSISVPLAIDSHAVGGVLVLVSVWTLLHFILSVLLIVLFMNKLNCIIVSNTKIEHTGTSDHDASDANGVTMRETQETMKKNDLFQLAVKHNILVRFAIISTLLTFLITFAILATDDASIRFITGTVYSFDCTISAVCVYLLFAFHHQLYVKLCFRMHRRCESRKAQQLENAMSE